MVDEGRHRWLRLHQQQHQCARTTTAVAKASLLRTRAAFCMQRRPRRRLHAVDLAAEGPQPSLPGPDARSLALCVALLSACLPASRAPSLPLCVPGRLRRALSCSLAAHARTALRLAVVLGTPLLAAEAHTSATTADLSTPPPHPSPSLCSRQESSRHTGPSQRGSRVSGGEGGKPLSPSQRFTGGVTKRPNDIPRLCCRRNLPSGDL